LQSFCAARYPTDVYLQELIAIDYYLHFKVKPQAQYLQEVERPLKAQVLKELNANHHKYRHIVLPISFNFTHFVNTQILLSEPNNLCIQYNGTEKAVLLLSNNEYEPKSNHNKETYAF
jgi:hypothetical protein